jgi:hypothetical protein
VRTDAASRDMSGGRPCVSPDRKHPRGQRRMATQRAALGLVRVQL